MNSKLQKKKNICLELQCHYHMQASQVHNNAFLNQLYLSVKFAFKEKKSPQI